MQAHTLSVDDVQFRSDFENGRLLPAHFNHAAHVRLAYVYLAESEVESAITRMRDALLNFLAQHGIDPAKFHETMTRAWVLAVRHFMDRSGSNSAEDFMARNPQLLDSTIMFTHYSAGVLFSSDARESFVEPDLDPIPQHAAQVPPAHVS